MTGEERQDSYLFPMDRDDQMSLWIFLVHSLKAPPGKGDTEAAQLMVRRSECTIYDWVSRLIATWQQAGSTSGVLWENDELNR